MITNDQFTSFHNVCCFAEIDACASAPCIHGDCYTARPEQGPIVDDTELEFGQLPNEIESQEEPSVGNLPSHDINQLASRLKVDTSSLQELLARRGFISSKRRGIRSTDDVAQQPGKQQLLNFNAIVSEIYQIS